MRRSLNFNHLECFFCLARNLSFSKTSEELQIAQPAVSKQIKALEAHFNLQLFIRTKQKVQLTKDGKEIYESLYSLYNEICCRADYILEKQETLNGKIVFGCLGEVGERIFIQPLSLFKQKYPELVIEIKFLKGAEIIEGIKSGDIDLGIVSTPLIQENIRSYEILSEDIQLVTNAGNSKIKLPAIQDCSFVTYRSNDPLFDFYLQKVFPKLKRSKLNVEFSVNSHKSMVEILKKHPYYSVLPSLSIKDELKTGTLVNVGPKSLKSSLYLVYLDLEFPDKKINKLSKFLRAHMKNKD